LALRDRLALNEPAQVALLGLGPRILRILGGKILEISALLGLREDVFGLFLNFGDFGVGFSGGEEEDVLSVDAVLHLVLLDIRLIGGLQLLVGHSGILAELAEIEQTVTDDPLIRDLELGLVLLEVGLNLGVIRNDLSGQFLGLGESIVELDLFVLVAEFLLDFTRANADAVGDEAAELLLDEAGANQL